MKEIVSVLLLLVLLVSLSSCATEPVNNNVHQTDPQTQSNSAHGMISYPSVRDLTEYEKFITTAYAAPPNFIPYNAIRELGNFVAFTYYPTYNGEYYLFSETSEPVKTDRRYYYVLETDNGDRLRFSVDNCNALDPTTARTLPVSARSPQSLLKIENAEGVYQRGNIYYHYYHGTLDSIWWQEGSNLIKVWAWENSFEKLMDNEHPVILKLMTSETAETAIAEFNANIAAARQQAEIKAD